MGGGDFGGNGSVEWKVDVDKADSVVDQPQGSDGKGRFQRGVDRATGSEPGNLFEIRIEPPEGMSAADFVPVLASRLRTAGGKVEFDLVIEAQNPDQIQIRWGRHLNMQSGRVKASKANVKLDARKRKRTNARRPRHR